MNRVKHYYAGSNSSLGFYSLYEQALEGIENLYILKGGPGTGKSTLIQGIGHTLAEKGWAIEFVHCSSDYDSLDGVLIPALKTGIVDGTAPHIVDPKYPGVLDCIVNLGAFRDDDKLKADRPAITSLTDDIAASFTKAYKAFADAKTDHDRLENIYIGAMDFQKAHQVTQDLMNKIFPTLIKKETSPTVKHLFLGANTPSGSVDYIDNLTADVQKRYIIKGRAGSGKSTLMKKIGAHAEKQGISVQYFHCAFDPNSLDMVILPSEDIAVLDGTAPHVIEPNREHDEVVDMFALCIDANIEVEKAKELHEVETAYKSGMQKGISYLAEAKTKHDELEAYYIQAMDFNAVKQKKEEMLAVILSLAESKHVVEE